MTEDLQDMTENPLRVALALITVLVVVGGCLAGCVAVIW